jgi:hypothetical protein
MAVSMIGEIHSTNHDSMVSYFKLRSPNLRQDALINASWPGIFCLDNAFASIDGSKAPGRSTVPGYRYSVSLMPNVIIISYMQMTL